MTEDNLKPEMATDANVLLADSAWKIITHRKPVPTVIQNRMGEVKQWIRHTKRIDKLKYELEKVFANTKVQVGEIEDKNNVTFLFIRNQGKGIAHILIKRKAQ